MKAQLPIATAQQQGLKLSMNLYQTKTHLSEVAARKVFFHSPFSSVPVSNTVKMYHVDIYRLVT